MLFEPDLLIASLKDVVMALEDRKVSSEQLVTDYLRRIQKDNIAGLGLRAVIETAPCEKLLDVARRLDHERSQGRIRSRLHGIPILVKDSIATHPDMGMETTGGTLALRGSRVPANADVVDNMLAAGIIVLGKANLTVLGNCYGLDTPNGWSPSGGQTLSAYGPGEFDPSGSSSGSAVGLAAGFCAASIGGETDGSIVLSVDVPCQGRGTVCAEANRRASTRERGDIDLACLRSGERSDLAEKCSYRQDCLGPIGKSAWDVAALLETMTPGSTIYVRHTGPPFDDISRYKLGIVRRGFPPEGSDEKNRERGQDAKKLFERSVTMLNGSEIVDPANIKDIEELWAETGASAHPTGAGKSWIKSKSGLLLVTELYGAMNDHLAWVTDCELKSIEDLVEWNEAHPTQAFVDPESPERQEHLRRAVETKGDKTGSFATKLAEVERLASNIDQAFDQHGVDVLIFPGEPSGGTRATTVAASGGYPIATVPLGLMGNGEPYGMYLMGRKGAEGVLLGVMAACEKILPARPVPTLLISE